MLEGINKKVQELNDHILPQGVKLVPFIDRSDLLHFTTHTVLHNLTEGIILVVIILFLFLGNVRGAIIVALTIPFSLLFASICLDLKHIPANLLSLGALDFGMVVDGAVVMVENIVRHLVIARIETTNADRADSRSRARSATAGFLCHRHHHHRLFAHLHLASSGRPALQAHGVDGGLCIAGRADFSMIVAPVLSSLLFRKGAKEWKNPVMEFLTTRYRKAVTWAIHHRWSPSALALSASLIAIYLAFGGVIGSEFLPHLDEGALWVRGTLAQSAGPSDGIRVANEARILLCSFPEVTECTSQTGRPDDGTDHTGFFNTEYFVGLKPKEQWRPVFHQDKDNLIASMNDAALEKNSRRDLGLLAADRRQHGGGSQRSQGRACYQGLWQ